MAAASFRQAEITVKVDYFRVADATLGTTRRHIGGKAVHRQLGLLGGTSAGDKDLEIRR
jgi:hypothetical protein